MSSLSDREKGRIDELIAKFNQENLEKEEGIELQGLLKRRQQEAIDMRNVALAIGAGMLLAALIGYLFDKK